MKVGNKFMNSLCRSLELTNHLEELNLSNNRLDDSSISLLFQNLSKSKNLGIKSVDLSKNLITILSLEKMIDYMKIKNCNLKKLNLESNKMGDKLVCELVTTIVQYNFEKFEYLNLNDNKITKESAKTLSELTGNCGLLKHLLLSNNELCNSSAALILSNLRKHGEIKVLDLSWNIIGNLEYKLPTREELLQKYIKEDEEKQKILEKNSPKKDDPKKKKPDKKGDDPLSKYYILLNNVEIEEKKYKIGEDKSNLKVERTKLSPFAIELGNFFVDNESLIHLDISHNNIINEVDCEYLSSSIIKNHSILGCHVEGNNLHIDDLGFLHVLNKKNLNSEYYANSQINYNIENNLNKYNNKLKVSDIVRSIRGKNNCWICDGWRETKFTYKPKYLASLENTKTKLISPNKQTQEVFKDNEMNDKNNDTYGGGTVSGFLGTNITANVKIHLSVDNYKSIEVDKNIESYYYYRMCRPGTINYFFTINGEPVVNYGKNTVFLNEAIIKKSDSNNPEEDDTYIINKVAEMNVYPIDGILDSNLRPKLKFCIPRPSEKLIVKERPNTPWSFPISIWSYYGYNFNGTPEQALREAFEFDYEKTKIEYDKDIKSQEEVNQVKELLRKNYSMIIDTYKYLSSNTALNVFQITQNSINEFCSNCNGLIDKNYSINFVFLKEAEVINLDIEDKKNKNKLLPDNMIRHQFLAFLVKIAKDKYISKIERYEKVFDALNYTFENHYKYYLRSINHNFWRIDRYYNEYVDNFIKAFLPILDAFFKSYSKREIGKTK